MKKLFIRTSCPSPLADDGGGFTFILSHLHILLRFHLQW